MVVSMAIFSAFQTYQVAVKTVRIVRGGKFFIWGVGFPRLVGSIEMIPNTPGTRNRILLLWPLDNGFHHAAIESQQGESERWSVLFPTILDAFAVKVQESLQVGGRLWSIKVVPLLRVVHSQPLLFRWRFGENLKGAARVQPS